MSQEAYEALHQELLGKHEATAELYKRWQKLQAREIQWQAARKQAQTNDVLVSNLSDDATYAAIVSEREAIMLAQKQNLAQPRSDKAATAALRAQLTPEEKSRLRQDLLVSLQSSPPEVKEMTVAAIDEVTQRFQAEHGSTPGVEAALAKIERLKKQMNGSA